MSSSLRDMALAGKRLTDFPIIDWHVHIGTWSLFYAAATIEELLSVMERVGVRKTCVNNVFSPDCKKGNDELAALAKKYPQQIIPFAAINPYQCYSMVDELKRCIQELGMKGLKLHYFYQGPYSPEVKKASHEWPQVWQLCAREKVPVLYHGVVTDENIIAHPETVFVQAHGAGDPEHARRMAPCKNFYVDTPWTQNRAWTITEIVSILGAERVLWGTDAPLDDFAQRLGVVLDSGLSLEDQKNILGRNALRLLGIES